MNCNCNNFKECGSCEHLEAYTDLIELKKKLLEIYQYSQHIECVKSHMIDILELVENIDSDADFFKVGGWL